MKNGMSLLYRKLRSASDSARALPDELSEGSNSVFECVRRVYVVVSLVNHVLAEC